MSGVSGVEMASAKDGDAFGRHIGKPAGQRETALCAVIFDNKLTFADHRHDRAVIWQNTEIAFDAGNGYGVHALGNDEAFG